MTCKDFLTFNIYILLANILILGVSIKIYTEYVKDKLSSRRKNEDPKEPPKASDAKT